MVRNATKGKAAWGQNGKNEKKNYFCIISGLGWVNLRLFLDRTLRLGQTRGTFAAAISSNEHKT